MPRLLSCCLYFLCPNFSIFRRNYLVWSNAQSSLRFFLPETNNRSLLRIHQTNAHTCHMCNWPWLHYKSFEYVEMHLSTFFIYLLVVLAYENEAEVLISCRNVILRIAWPEKEESRVDYSLSLSLKAYRARPTYTRTILALLAWQNCAVGRGIYSSC